MTEDKLAKDLRKLADLSPNLEAEQRDFIRQAANEIEQLRSHLAGVQKEQDRVARYREALEWYAQEGFYRMTSFRTAAPLQDLSGMPVNIEIKGNPIAHDRGKRAREALAGGEVE